MHCQTEEHKLSDLKEEVIFFIQSVTLFWWGFWYSRVLELAKYHYSILTMDRWLAQLLLAAPGEHFKVQTRPF